VLRGELLHPARDHAAKFVPRDPDGLQLCRCSLVAFPVGAFGGSLFQPYLIRDAPFQKRGHRVGAVDNDAPAHHTASRQLLMACGCVASSWSTMASLDLVVARAAAAPAQSGGRPNSSVGVLRPAEEKQVPRGIPKTLISVRLDPALLDAVRQFEPNTTAAIDDALRQWLSRQRRRIEQAKRKSAQKQSR
jgi:uncharacterized protein (DUF4415 family)